MDAGQAQALHQIHPSPFAAPGSRQHFSQDAPPRSTPMLTMNDNEVPVTTESLEQQPTGMWTTPSSHGLRPRPATIHEGWYHPSGEDYGSLTPWDSSALPLQQFSNNHDAMSRPGSVHSFHQPHGPYGNQGVLDNSWMHTSCEDNVELHMDPNVAIGQAFTTDEAIPVLDLQYSHKSQEGDALNHEDAPRVRRMSGSSFTVSTAFSDMPCDEFSAAVSDVPSMSDYPPTSNRNSLMSSTHLSPVASPRMTPQSRTELVRTQSRGRASPSPRPGVRSAPYNVDVPRNKRWSTGSYATTPQRRSTPFGYQPNHDIFSNQNVQLTSSPTAQPDHHAFHFSTLQTNQQPMWMGSNFYPRNNQPAFLPSQGTPQGFHAHIPTPAGPPCPPTLMSQSLYRMLSSNGDHHGLHSHQYPDVEPPNLYGSLSERPDSPPPEDMNPSDPDLVPHEQEPRFEGDLYTPKYVRGHGNKREGWCGLCKPGRWLVLKNSAFWYDKSFTHGVSAATGNAFNEPLSTRRMDGNPDVWEGLCSSCNDWVPLVSAKKKGTTWFRHAYKCHTHQKVKDASKRRRDTSASRVLPASQLARPCSHGGDAHGHAHTNAHAHAPITPQSTPAMLSLNTPTPDQRGRLAPFPPPQLHHFGLMESMMSSPSNGEMI